MAKKSNIHIKPSKEGTFREAVGVKEGEKVSAADENKILNADPNEKVRLSTGKTVTATPELKKKANFAKNARRW
jgi:hypothetical protein